MLSPSRPPTLHLQRSVHTLAHSSIMNIRLCFHAMDPDGKGTISRRNFDRFLKMLPLPQEVLDRAEDPEGSHLAAVCFFLR